MEFKHPKYYKELRLRNRSFLLRKEECTLGKLGNKAARIPPTSSGQAASDQGISDHPAAAVRRVRPDPGLKPQAASNKREAQATSKRSRRKHKRKPEPSSGSQAS